MLDRSGALDLPLRHPPPLGNGCIVSVFFFSLALEVIDCHSPGLSVGMMWPRERAPTSTARSLPSCGSSSAIASPGRGAPRRMDPHPELWGHVGLRVAYRPPDRARAELLGLRVFRFNPLPFAPSHCAGGRALPAGPAPRAAAAPRLVRRNGRPCPLRATQLWAPDSPAQRAA